MKRQAWRGAEVLSLGIAATLSMLVATAPAQPAESPREATAQPAAQADATSGTTESKPPDGAAKPPAEAAPSSGNAPGSTPPGTTPSGATPQGAATSDKPAETTPTPPAPIVRPSNPDQPAGPDSFQVRPDANGMLQFQFRGAPWPALIEWLSEVSGMSIDWQELPGDYVNLQTQRAYSVREVRDLINRHLLARGYTMLQDGEFLHVVKTTGINTAVVPRVSLSELAQCFPHDFVKISFELDWLLAERLSDEVKSMISKNGMLIPLKTTNRLEAIDAAENLRQIARLIQEEQSTESQNHLVREFVLKHSRASQVKQYLEQLLGQEQKPNMPLTPEQQMQQQQMMMQMQQLAAQRGQPDAGNLGAKTSDIQLVVNAQRNSILAQAPPDRMAVIAEAIRLLDVPASRDDELEARVSRIQTYRMATLDPQEVVDILLETGSLEPDTRLKVDPKNKAIIVNGPPWDHLTIQKLIKKLDGSPRNFKVVRLRRRRADQVAATVAKLMVGDQAKDDKSSRRQSWYYYEMFGGREEESKPSDSFRVAADVERNWLLLWCNESEHERVMGLLSELGEVIGQGEGSGETRVLEGVGPEEVDELMKKVRAAFGPLAPNPIEFTPSDAPPGPQAEPASPPKTDIPLRDDAAGEPEPAAEPGAAGDRPADDGRPGLESATDVGTLLPTETALQLAMAQAADEARASGGESISDRVDSLAAQNEAEKRATNGSNSGPAPIQIRRSADGRLLIHSNDTAALDLFEELVDKIRSPQKAYTVFKLKHASATWVSLQLEDYFDEDDKDDDRNRPWWMFDEQPEQESAEPTGLEKPRPIRFISDFDTNTIVVRDATEDQLKIVRELIELYDIQDPIDREKVRQTQLIKVRYSRASMIANQIKDAFRDLLSDNDRAFQEPQQGGEGAEGQPRQRRGGASASGGSSGLDFGAGDDRQKSSTRVAFQGKLSLGIDDVTNTLLVSTEGETLMKIVVAMIKELDESAKPIDEVRVIRLRSGTSYGELHEALKRTFGDQVQVSDGRTNGNAPAAPQGQQATENRPQPGTPPGALATPEP
ncbi:MAG: secretin N-terminal domain-containing protein [Pirellulales bacterium]